MNSLNMNQDTQQQLELDPKSIEKATEMLRNIDLKDIDVNDPMTKGPTLQYELDLIMTVKLKSFKRNDFGDEADGMSSNEVIHLRVFNLGHEETGDIFVELTSEDDLFFHY